MIATIITGASFSIFLNRNKDNDVSTIPKIMNDNFIMLPASSDFLKMKIADIASNAKMYIE